MSQTKVLVVDVDRNVLDRLSHALSYTGALVYNASGSETALRQVEIVHPDLVILNIPSEESDRWETLHQIREQRPYIPVIALTSPDDLGTTVDSLRHGADYSMTKPVRVRELQARVRALLRRTQRLMPLSVVV